MARLPFETYFSDINELGEDELRELRRLLGLGPSASLDEIRRAMARVNRLWSRRCLRLRGFKDCVIIYKESLVARDYLERPVLAAARGAVVRHYGGGGVRQLSMPFAKFFNYRECRECSKLPGTRCIAREKLDGTLVIAYRDPDTGELLLSTRGSLHRPPVANNPYAERFLAAVKRLGLGYELESLVGDDTTAMFELVNRECPASHCLGRELEKPPGDPAWTPYLLALRDNKSLELIIPEPTAFPAPRSAGTEDPREALRMAKRLSGEGVVIYFPGETYLGFRWWNYMLKAKNRVYVFKALLEASRADEATKRSMYRRIARQITLGRIDDLLPLLEGTEYKAFAQEYYEAYRGLVEAYTRLSRVLRDLVERIGFEKTRRILENNLSATIMARHLDTLLEDPEKTAARITREHLLARGGGKHLVEALERHRRRVETIIESLVKHQY